MKKKIKNQITEKIYLFSSLKTGGIKTYCETLEKSLKNNNFQVIVVKKKIQAIQVLLNYLFKKSFKKNNKIRFITWGIYNLIPFKRDNHLCIFHGFPSIRQQGFLRFILNLFTIYICKLRNSKSVSISKYVHSILLDVYSFKTKVIRNAIPLNVIMKSKKIDDRNFEKKIDITFLGRPTKFKFPMQMVNHIKYLSTKNYKISIIGQSKYLDSLANELKNKNITIYGNLEYDSIRNILFDSKLIFNCSDSEPFGLIYLEALYNLCHVFSPRSGGSLEIYSLLSEKIKPLFAFYDNLETSLDLIERTIINSTKNLKEISESNFDFRKEIELNFSNEKQIFHLLNCFIDPRK